MITDKQKKYLLLKRGVDIVLSGGAIVVLSPILGLLALAIKLDSPGPVLFKQKRVGKDKELFEIYKFRTMRTDTPKDMPTHMLKDPDQFITKTGKFLRKTSLDELPQIFNIFTGKMSIIGPRPALWNQDDLIAERDKYHANDVTPGLTGWAQINGRDELEIDVKAKFDGDYVNDMGLKMDIKCFLATIGSVLLGDGVVEGGTGELEKTVDIQIIDPEKIDKEAKIGAAVVGTAGAVGLRGMSIIGKCIKNKDQKNKSHIKIISGVGITMISAGLLINHIKKNKERRITLIRESVSKNIIDNNLTEPLVSIVMPTYRNDKSLKESINSIINQTYKNIELVIVDDNGKKEWNNKVESIINIFKDKIYINLIVNEINQGSAKTRNIGIDAAKGEYITFLDDDDIYLPKKVEMQLRFMQSDSSKMNIMDLNIYDDNGKLIRKRRHDYLLEDEDYLKLHLMHHLTGTDTLMFKKNYLLEIGKFDEIDMGDEFYLVLKAIINKGKISYLPECHTKAYAHVSGVGITAGSQKEDGENLLFDKKKEYFKLLNKNDVAFIKMRHYLVLASCGLKKHDYLKMINNLFMSFLSSPKSFLCFCLNRKQY